MYIAGSHTARDWFDDVTKIPFYGDLRESERYKKAYEAFQHRGEIDTVVGHSLGGSVSLELQKNFSDRVKHNRTYGAPLMDLMGLTLLLQIDTDTGLTHLVFLIEVLRGV